MYDRDWEWNTKVARLEARLMELESSVSSARAEQAEILAELDRFQVDLADGDRGMQDWISAHLDMSPQGAHRLWTLAKSNDPWILEQMRLGRFGLDRASHLVKLSQCDVSSDVLLGAADDYSLGRLWGLVEQLREVTSNDERASFKSRYLVIQPSLDESVFKVWGQLHGVDGQTVDKALRQRAGEFPSIPGQSQGQGMADALASVCADSMTAGSESGREGRAVTVAEVFVDASLAASSFGEAGVTLSSGLRVGPNTLSEILCDGKIRVIWTDGENGPMAVSHLSEAIPPATRNWVLHRDQGQCSIEGCRNRNRLQIHHIHPRALGGNHDPSNLVTLCWYHHHVAIHELGYRIDPNSPSHRRRLIGWRPTTGPPIRYHLLAGVSALPSADSAGSLEVRPVAWIRPHGRQFHHVLQ